ncbi:MAG: leucyl aminopeptidase [Halobacteriovoraceae bacterium]|nr:leucyl aminopeptidase [Halobacteriovoraceae bacterium]|tara:strand:+ start:171643 stop:172830 length:1188 start_codon:yes stop_codon:yes gene_type:complete
MFKLIIGLSTILATSVFAAPKDYLYVTIGSDAVSGADKSLSTGKEIATAGGISVMRIHKNEVLKLSTMMHDKFNRCGGFVAHESLEEAQKVLSNGLTRKFSKSMPFLTYTIDQQETVESLVAQTSEFSIRTVIEKLSSYRNRYYKAQTGVDSQAWLKGKWTELGEGRSDVKVEYFNHSRWPQPSVVMTIEGNSLKDEIVVIGGHADSIAGFWGRERAHAPGADDNASGIATVTEVIRLAMENGYTPERTIKFMAYAAEEVGLLGSKEIANTYKKAGKNVVGVLQLDMTNHKGTEDLDIVFMSDFTNESQNKFLAKLIDTYVKVPWGWSQCGYGCSDHASWHNAGYPASIPFESTMRDINGKIHTKHDTIEQSGGNADHAEKFAKLAVAFMVELGK